MGDTKDYMTKIVGAESMKAADVLQGLRGVRVCKNVRNARREVFGIRIPNWLVQNKEIDLRSIICCELRRRLNDYRKYFPVKNERQAQMVMVKDDMRIIIDACSAEMASHDETCISFDMNVRISNSL